MRIFSYLKDIIAPKKCYSCGDLGAFFCSKCLKETEKHSPYCYVCKEPSSNFLVHNFCLLVSNIGQIIVFGKYTNKYLKKSIHDGKFYGKKEIYKELAPELGKFFLENHSIIDRNNYIVVATPMFFLKKWKRGFNHAAVLSQEISQILDIPFYKNIIYKRKHTRQQSHLSKQQRVLNVKNTICINKKQKNIVKGKTVILIDDVVSTGATLREAGGLLRLHGAKSIIALVIASD